MDTPIVWKSDCTGFKEQIPTLEPKTVTEAEPVCGKLEGRIELMVADKSNENAKLKVEPKLLAEVKIRL